MRSFSLRLNLTPLEKRTVEYARSLLGNRETGSNGGPFVRMLQRWVARGATWLDNQPWCVCFATYCVHQAAAKLGVTPRIPRSASSSRLYQWCKDNDLLCEPTDACLGFVRGGPTGHSHTFIVVMCQGPYVYGIDGNLRDAVRESQRLVGECDYARIC